MRKLGMLLGAVLSVAMFSSVFAASPLTITLNSINDSGVSGTAVLTPMGNQTQVVLTVTGEPAGASEPVHIHVGQCGPTLGKVQYPLKNVEGGKSTTVVNATLASLQNGNFAINLHESAANIKTYIACGNIPAMAATTTALPKTGGTPVAAVIIVAGLLVGAGYTLRRRFA